MTAMLNPTPQVVPCSWQHGGPITMASDTEVIGWRPSTTGDAPPSSGWLFPSRRRVEVRPRRRPSAASIVGSDDLAVAVAELRSPGGGGHILCGDAHLAGALIRQDLIDEYWLFIHPTIFGAGPRPVGELAQRLTPQPVELPTFAGGVVHLRYRSAH